MKNQVTAVYIAGLIQGLCLVTFPAASAIFTSPQDFHLSSAAYGSLFIPQAIISIIASLFSAQLSDRWGIKRVFLIGLIANLVAMLLLTASSIVMRQSFAYFILLCATASLGCGFGLMVPALNTLAARLFPKKVDTAVLALNALLGLGTALAPLLITLFVGFSVWWGLPLFLALTLICLFAFSYKVHFEKEKQKHKEKTVLIPSHFWLFAAFALLYGMIETVNGNWAVVFMKNTLHEGVSAASLALTLFWTMITVGRVFFALTEKWISEKFVFRVLPLVVACAFIFAAEVSEKNGFLGLYIFGLAGFGCSALLPLTISFADKAIASSIAGVVIAFYLLGYGIAAFGTGVLMDYGRFSLSTIFGCAAVVALGLSGLSFVITCCRRKKV
ncbi:MAG: MFS transporter [Chlamydiota bacterium]